MKFILEIDCDGVRPDDLRHVVAESLVNASKEVLEGRRLSGSTFAYSPVLIGRWRFVGDGPQPPIDGMKGEQPPLGMVMDGM